MLASLVSREGSWTVVVSHSVGESWLVVASRGIVGESWLVVAES